MKSRVLKSKKFQQKRKSFKETMSSIFLQKGQNQLTLKNIASPEAISKAASKSGVGLGMTLLAGHTVQYLSTIRNENIKNLNLKNLSIESQFEEVTLEEKFVNQDFRSKASNTTPNTKKEIKNFDYLPVSNLNNANYGTYKDRYSAIYKKIYYNQRIIQTSDLKEIDSISKGQHKYGISMLLSLSLFPFSCYSKTLSHSSKTRVLFLGIGCLFTSMAFLTYYNGRFQKFLVH